MNLSSDASCNLYFTNPTSQKSVDPLLGPLQNNGGPTKTMALPSNSPAIDYIPAPQLAPSTCIFNSKDQRGFSRPDNGELTCDIGAYEFQDSAPSPPTHQHVLHVQGTSFAQKSKRDSLSTGITTTIS